MEGEHQEKEKIIDKRIPEQQMKKVHWGFTTIFSNIYEENYEDFDAFPFTYTEEVTIEDLDEAPYLLPVKNILQKNNFFFDIRSVMKAEESFFFLFDNYMKKFFNCYPDYICVDKLELKLQLTLYLFISVDSNGISDIIAVGLLKTCDNGILWLCDMFKKHMNWQSIKFILCDTSLGIHPIFKNAFHEKPIWISFFHSMTLFKKDISCIGLEANDPKAKTILLIFEQMIFTTDKVKYFELLKQLENFPEVHSYFVSFWHEHKMAWTLKKQFDFKLLMKSFHVYMKVLREYVTSFLSSPNSIEEILKSCCSFIKIMRKEKFKNVSLSFQKPLVNTKQVACAKYSKHLTYFAANLIVSQINNSYGTKFEKLPCGNYTVESGYITNPSSCNCSFFKYFSLPCNHIFFVRKKLCLLLFDESLCHTKWIQSNYLKILIELTMMMHDNDPRMNEIIAKSICQGYYMLSSVVWSFIQDRQSVPPQLVPKLQSIVEKWGPRPHEKFSIFQKNMTSTRLYSRKIITEPARALTNLSDYHWKEFYGLALEEFLQLDNNVLYSYLKP